MFNSDIWMDALNNLIKDKKYKAWKIATYPESEEVFLASYEIQVGEEDAADGESVTPIWSNDPKDFGFTYSDFKAEEKSVQAEYDANKYQRDRNYPVIGEQLDMLFHDMTAGKGSKDGEWYKAVAKVKSDNPKPE